MIRFAETPAAPVRVEPAEYDERLADEIAELAAHLHAATYRLLVLLGEFDAREGWGWGFKSCAHWLSWRTGIAPVAAREKVRVARALGALPLMWEAMERGAAASAFPRRRRDRVRGERVRDDARRAGQCARRGQEPADGADGDAAARLRRDNAPAASTIGPWTATPRWHGEPLDTDWALHVMRGG
jgi:hypothetical protein